MVCSPYSAAGNYVILKTERNARIVCGPPGDAPPVKQKGWGRRRAVPGKDRFMTITLPYDEGTLTARVRPERPVQTAHSKLHRYQPPQSPEELVRHAMENPIGSPPL